MSFSNSKAKEEFSYGYQIYCIHLTWWLCHYLRLTRIIYELIAIKHLVECLFHSSTHIFSILVLIKLFRAPLHKSKLVLRIKNHSNKNHHINIFNVIPVLIMLFSKPCSQEMDLNFQSKHWMCSISSKTHENTKKKSQTK